VVVVDTGLDLSAPNTHPWLKGVDGERDTAIQGNTIGAYGGHGTFVAGVVRSVAPNCEVHVVAAVQPVGAVIESTLVQRLYQVLGDDCPDIVSLSCGTVGYDGAEPLGFGALCRVLSSQHKGVVVVAAAGNHGSRERFWPAAAPCTVSVGALARDWRSRAAFSNYGGWVDVFAPGEDLINAFAVGNYVYQEPPRKGQVATFHGLARWSGTSFSTPIVAGAIAVEMSRTGANGRHAAATLLTAARARAIPGLGAVLLPD